MKSIIKPMSFALSLLLALSLLGCSAAPKDTAAPIATEARGSLCPHSRTRTH